MEFISVISSHPGPGENMTKAFGRCRFVTFIGAILFSTASLMAEQSQDATKTSVHLKSAEALKNAIVKLDELFAEEYAKNQQASATIGIISGDKLIWTKSYGLADIGNHTPATKDSVYRIASITKQFTALMLLQLVQQGKVHLADPVRKYYPEIDKIPNPYSFAPSITLYQLATHTSGLSGGPYDNDASENGGPVADWDKILLSALPLVKYTNEPGTKFNYSNVGYAILGEALSRAAGEPYIQYEKRHILEPLGMEHSGFELNEEMKRNLARGYEVKGKSTDPTMANSQLYGRGYTVPNAGLFTSVTDLAHFLSFEMGYGPEEVLPRSVLANNFSQELANGDLTQAYGLGFRIWRFGNLLAVGHGGSMEGYYSQAYFNPSEHIGIVWLRNAQGDAGFDGVTLQGILKLLSSKGTE